MRLNLAIMMLIQIGLMPVCLHLRIQGRIINEARDPAKALFKGTDEPGAGFIVRGRMPAKRYVVRNLAYFLLLDKICLSGAERHRMTQITVSYMIISEMS